MKRGIQRGTIRRTQSEETKAKIKAKAVGRPQTPRSFDLKNDPKFQKRLSLAIFAVMFGAEDDIPRLRG